MSEIAQKALALVNEVERDFGDNSPTIRIIREDYMDEALCRAIEKHEADKAAHAATVEGILNSHEAYKREVSDAVESYFRGVCAPHDILARFILPKPDPLVEALNAMWRPLGAEPNVCEDEFDANDAAKLREALAKRGLKIVETGQ